ncbi:Thioredoxin-like protein Clot [Smittium culicis]|uniref:Thioredoxin-like protein Clot n=1 Tax=Smittium culicis TaxID=133412 RepID=A0A1R1XV62_9FUNG|nr:Thioredoxin-like protein Clot [Smittium culicis]
MYVYVGRESQSTGESYCPDCTKAIPIIAKALDSFGARYTLLKVPVDGPQDTNSETYAFRKRRDTNLTAVPTLIAYNSQGITGRLVESQLLNYNNIIRFLSSHFQ